jgi:glutamate formiminotransferase
MPFYRSGLFSLTLLGRLLVEFTSPKLGEDARFFTGTLEATQGGVKILILANTNAGHSNLNIEHKAAAGIRRQGGAF